MNNNSMIESSSTPDDELALIAQTTAAHESTVVASLHDLTTAVCDMVTTLGQVPDALLVYGDGAIIQRWQNINYSLRNNLTASRLAASSMTVLLSEYTNVILKSIATGQVPIPALQAEIAGLMQSAESRHRELTSPGNIGAMQNLCADLARLITDTRSHIKSSSSKVTEKARTGALLLLDELDVQLNRWTSKRTKANSAVLEKLNSGVFICAPAAVLLNPKAVHKTLVQINTGNSANPDISWNVDGSGYRNNKHETLVESQEFDILQDLDKHEQANPEFAQKVDIISDIYHMFQLELKSLRNMLTNEQESAIRNEAFVKRVNVICGLYGGLIKAMDLYSKQPLLRQHVTTSHTTLVAKKRTSFSGLKCIPNASCMSRTFS